MHGLGKGKGSPKKRPVRVDTIKGIGDMSLRKLARRGGVKRISKPIYPHIRETIVEFLNDLIRDTVSYTQYAHRSIVTSSDVCYAMKRRGHTLYGFNQTQDRVVANDKYF
ncbi:histone H4 [Basidiobolus meristosporus CBS 931.73]|uniref:Histone H4 n=1 Tax=Basidiobolus meristosporus CBS 931.73 TaxID=1314790 RepID=A0A1Y1XUA7_9FUNG|nr:histone H4 [Basidiobolus meristosporus CBS 931.73]|eukprot:ORX89330.1 histone H4 [Basidiobolus meristosporus CBS 931.73]